MVQQEKQKVFSPENKKDLAMDYHIPLLDKLTDKGLCILRRRTEDV